MQFIAELASREPAYCFCRLNIIQIKNAFVNQWSAATQSLLRNSLFFIFVRCAHLESNECQNCKQSQKWANKSKIEIWNRRCEIVAVLVYTQIVRCLLRQTSDRKRSVATKSSIFVTWRLFTSTTNVDRDLVLITVDTQMFSNATASNMTCGLT